MDNLTLALRPMIQASNWVRLVLACGAFFLAFQVAHAHPLRAMGSPATSVAAQTDFPNPGD